MEIFALTKEPAMAQTAFIPKRTLKYASESPKTLIYITGETAMKP